MKRLFSMVCVGVSITACGSNSTPIAATPTTVQVGGVWRGSFRTTSVTGGECFGSLLQGAVGGFSPVTMAVTQNGAALTATVTDDNSGGNFTYTGTAGQSAISLTGTFCSSCNRVNALCPSGTGLRDLKIQTLSVSGAISGNTMTGTESESYNVYLGGTTTALASLSEISSINLTRQ